MAAPGYPQAPPYYHANPYTYSTVTYSFTQPPPAPAPAPAPAPHWNGYGQVPNFQQFYPPQHPAYGYPPPVPLGYAPPPPGYHAPPPHSYYAPAPPPWMPPMSYPPPAHYPPPVHYPLPGYFPPPVDPSFNIYPPGGYMPPPPPPPHPTVPVCAPQERPVQPNPPQQLNPVAPQQDAPARQVVTTTQQPEVDHQLERRASSEETPQSGQGTRSRTPRRDAGVNAPMRTSIMTAQTCHLGAEAQQSHDIRDPRPKDGSRGYHTGDKLMVCDHCMSHGLTCNEDSVCDQCQRHGLACFRRLCADSPHSRDGCQNQSCHYAHLDHQPRYDEELPEYLIYPGSLPRWQDRGRKPDLRVLQDFTSWPEHYLELKQLRSGFDAEMTRWARMGQGTLETNRARCGDLCAPEGTVGTRGVV